MVALRQLMSAAFLQFIAQYGYRAIFVLVLLQAIGVPAMPNELTLLYAGYLSCQFLYFPTVLLVTVLADMVGALLLYSIFYCFGTYLLSLKVSWIQRLQKKSIQLEQRIEQNPFTVLFPLRLTPFVRGYVSVLVGLLRFPIKKYLPATLFSAFIWSGGWVLAGYLLAPYWNQLMHTHYGVYMLAACVLVLLFCYFFIKQSFKSKTI